MGWPWPSAAGKIMMVSNLSGSHSCLWWWAVRLRRPTIGLAMQVCNHGIMYSQSVEGRTSGIAGGGGGRLAPYFFCNNARTATMSLVEHMQPANGLPISFGLRDGRHGLNMNSAMDSNIAQHHCDITNRAPAWSSAQQPSTKKTPNDIGVNLNLQHSSSMACGGLQMP